MPARALRAQFGAERGPPADDRSLVGCILERGIVPGGEHRFADSRLAILTERHQILEPLSDTPSIRRRAPQELITRELVEQAIGFIAVLQHDVCQRIEMSSGCWHRSGLEMVEVQGSSRLQRVHLKSERGCTLVARRSHREVVRGPCQCRSPRSPARASAIRTLCVAAAFQSSSPHEPDCGARGDTHAGRCRGLLSLENRSEKTAERATPAHAGVVSVITPIVVPRTAGTIR